MAKKKGKKSSGHKKGSFRKAGSSAHEGVIALISDKTVLTGAAIGAGSALVVDIMYNLMGNKMPAFMNHPIMQAGVSAIAPAVLASFVSKDKNVVKTAAGVGLAGGMIAMIGDTIKNTLIRSQSAPTGKKVNTTVAGTLPPMNEEVYGQVQGATLYDPNGQIIDTSIQGEMAGELSGIEDEISGIDDEHFGLSGGMYDENGIAGNDDEIN